MALGSFFLKEPSKKEKAKEEKLNKALTMQEEEAKLLSSSYSSTDPRHTSSYKEIAPDSEDEKSSMTKVYEFMKKPQIFKPILFIFIFMITPSAGSSMFYFYTNELKFPPEFMGQLKLIHSMANILGITIYHKFLKLVPFKRLFFVSSIICVVTGLTQILLATR